jgi:hypothetical protein
LKTLAMRLPAWHYGELSTAGRIATPRHARSMKQPRIDPRIPVADVEQSSVGEIPRLVESPTSSALWLALCSASVLRDLSSCAVTAGWRRHQRRLVAKFASTIKPIRRGSPCGAFHIPSQFDIPDNWTYMEPPSGARAAAPLAGPTAVVVSDPAVDTAVTRRRCVGR